MHGTDSDLWPIFRKEFLGALAKLRKATDHLVMSIRPSVLTEQLCSRRKNFRGISHLIILRKFAEKIQVSVTSDNNNGYFT
jgi:hypothetical protein